MKYLFFFIFSLSIFSFSQNDSIMQQTIFLGDSSIKVIKQITNFKSKHLYLNIHEDEQTSIDVAQDFLEQTPINFVYLNHIQTRRINFNVKSKKYSVDPNRIYTKKGRRKTIEPSRLFNFKAKNLAAKLAHIILDLIQPYEVVITMHNNTDVEYSIKNYLPNGDEAQNTADIYISKNWDADDFIYTTSTDFFNHLKEADVNVILQDNKKYVNDGSLSVYCGINNIDYINIEAQKGHYDEQLKLLKIVHEILKSH